MVNALNSIKESTSDNWVLAFIDDASTTDEGWNLVDNILDGYSNQIVKYKVSREEKEEKYWTTQARYLNKATREIEADICIQVCDDDAIFPTYIENLSKFFEETDFVYGYSHIIPFNPLVETPNTSFFGRKHSLNFHITPIPPENQLDISQVAWKRVDALEKECIFPDYRNEDLDSRLFRHLFKNFGVCPFMNCVGQYKALHPKQLGYHKRVYDFELGRE